MKDIVGKGACSVAVVGRDRYVDVEVVSYPYKIGCPWATVLSREYFGYRSPVDQISRMLDNHSMMGAFAVNHVVVLVDANDGGIGKVARDDRVLVVAIA